MAFAQDCMLIGASQELVGFTYPVGADGLIVGRSYEAVLHLDGEGVSRFHARLDRCAEGTLVLSDLDSSNGTFVNDRRVEHPEPLQDGDRIRFGPHASFVVRYADRVMETLEMPAIGQEKIVDVLATRNMARVLVSERKYRGACALYGEVIRAFEETDRAAAEDVADALTELARCHVALEEHAEAVPICKRAIGLLLSSTAASRSMARARFVLGQALLYDEPEEARRIVQEATAGLPPGTALRQELEAWLAVANPASVG